MLHYNESIRHCVEEIANYGVDGEHICMWFDDLYFQGMHPNGPSERALVEWKACFTPGEFDVLSEFHEVFNAEVDRAESEPGRTNIKEAAQKALAALAALKQKEAR